MIGIMFLSKLSWENEESGKGEDDQVGDAFQLDDDLGMPIRCMSDWNRLIRRYCVYSQTNNY